MSAADARADRRAQEWEEPITADVLERGNRVVRAEAAENRPNTAIVIRAINAQCQAQCRSGGAA